MVAQTPTAALETSLARLHEAACVVRTSVEDCPEDARHPSDHKALSDLRDSVDDLVDAVDQARWSARNVQDGPAGLLAGVHEAVLRAQAVLHADLLPVDRRFDATRRVARVWGGPWRPWSEVVLTNLLEAAAALRDTEDRLAAAWANAVPPLHSTARPAPLKERAP